MARAVNAAADVIHRAQVNGTQTATGLAIALESAQLLQSPETARELERLRARVAELEAARNGSRPGGHSHPEADDVSLQVRKLRALLAGQRAVVSEPLEDPHDSPLHHDYRVGRDLPETGGAK